MREHGACARVTCANPLTLPTKRAQEHLRQEVVALLVHGRKNLPKRGGNDRANQSPPGDALSCSGLSVDRDTVLLKEHSEPGRRGEARIAPNPLVLVHSQPAERRTPRGLIRGPTIERSPRGEGG